MFNETVSFSVYSNLSYFSGASDKDVSDRPPLVTYEAYWPIGLRWSWRGGRRLNLSLNSGASEKDVPD